MPSPSAPARADCIRQRIESRGEKLSVQRSASSRGANACSNADDVHTEIHGDPLFSTPVRPVNSFNPKPEFCRRDALRYGENPVFGFNPLCLVTFLAIAQM